ncbi:hypothetical protein [Rhizobium sp. CSW-27]|uniref:hypothetical protein n=1 Tax=Rhizobium sp. CSW-27 TaxID=2839985 RepID=UPI001C0097D8|nr:hypothetical protein [Rhizobium sp. CSW-27]MBT9369113.1 hypothetical protein [Rhizobium sp. CSW-27]
MSTELWFFAVAIGPVLLGGAIVYALMRRRRINPVEDMRREEAVRDLYDKPGSRSR